MGVVSNSHRPLLGGIEIYTRGGANAGGTGTLTGVATKGSKKVLVTNAHVMAGEDANGNFRNPTGSEVMFQGGTGAGSIVGTHLDHETVNFGSNQGNKVDAAIIDLDSNVTADFKLHDEYHREDRILISGTKAPSINDEVLIIAAESGEVSGTVTGESGGGDLAGVHWADLIRIEGQEALRDGDSGAPVLYRVRDNVYQMMGVYFAHGGNATELYACKASNVESALGITFGHREPVANAGDDQAVLPNTVVTLDGSGSKVYDGDAKYQWEQVYAGVSTEPNPDFHRVTITNPATLKATFTMPENEQTLLFKLTVTDSYKLTSTDYVAVNLNRKPVANAGPDQQVGRGVRVDLKGSAEDPDAGQDVTYEWTKIWGPDVTLHNSKTLTPHFDAPNESAIFAANVKLRECRVPLGVRPRAGDVGTLDRHRRDPREPRYLHHRVRAEANVQLRER